MGVLFDIVKKVEVGRYVLGTTVADVLKEGTFVDEHVLFPCSVKMKDGFYTLFLLGGEIVGVDGNTCVEVVLDGFDYVGIGGKLRHNKDPLPDPLPYRAREGLRLVGGWMRWVIYLTEMRLGR